MYLDLYEDVFQIYWSEWTHVLFSTNQFPVYDFYGTLLPAIMRSNFCALSEHGIDAYVCYVLSRSPQDKYMCNCVLLKKLVGVELS